MLGYTTIGVSDLSRATEFYDALLAELGGKMMMDVGRIKFYGSEAGGAMLAICTPFDGQEHSAGNGVMISFSGGSPEGVQALYSKAIELGATDEGEPGQRVEFFYGAYVRDLDGNKLCFYHMTPTS